MARKSVREKILRTAAELFYREGIRAVGVDKIVERAGVVKPSLYNHFRSKDDLVAAYLEDYDRSYWGWFDEVAGRELASPRERLLEVFDAMAERLGSEEQRGCPFVNAMMEFPDPEHPAPRVAVRHKRELRERLRELAEEAGARDAEGLAEQLALLIDGARYMAHVFGFEGTIEREKEAAATLIRESCSRNDAEPADGRELCQEVSR